MMRVLYWTLCRKTICWSLLPYLWTHPHPPNHHSTIIYQLYYIPIVLILKSHENPIIINQPWCPLKTKKRPIAGKARSISNPKTTSEILLEINFNDLGLIENREYTFKYIYSIYSIASSIAIEWGKWWLTRLSIKIGVSWVGISREIHEPLL